MPVFFISRRALRRIICVIAVILLGIAAIVFLADFPPSKEVSSWPLLNKTIVIDAGHGGIDPGVIGYTGTREKELNLQISLVLADLLRQAGANVVMVRENDNVFSNRKSADLVMRVELAKKEKADAYISIHCNSLAGSPKWQGAQVFFKQGNQHGEALAKTIQAQLKQNLANTNREALPHKSSYILSNLSIPTVIAEVGFISNPKEEKLLLDPAYQWRVAWAIFAGSAQFFADPEGKAEQKVEIRS
ncbi:MAG: N-acetylmuramoyl-L-alanine amidase [Clostridiales bacterium]|jgi:N-acetylmuramoyl-L-alanine amidase|nr:N-acetylmuramoyl-L-alanine amidase [Clostridiales bacterium]MDR2713798.1 N-acetylmuramoyl-L-alanine amidase [Clostridiales bacterium]